MKHRVRRAIGILDVLICVITMVIVIHCCVGCTKAQQVKVGKIAETVHEIAPLATAITVSLPAPAWVVLVMNIVSSAAGAIVAYRKDNTIK